MAHFPTNLTKTAMTGPTFDGVVWQDTQWTDPRRRPGGTIVFSSVAHRKAAIPALAKLGFNYFNQFLDNLGYGIQFGNADWVKPGQTYVSGP